MGFDLNAEPLGLEEAFIDLNKPPDRGSFQIYGTLLELNEEPQHEEEHTYNDEAQQTQIAGGQQVNNPGYRSHNVISTSSISARHMQKS